MEKVLIFTHGIDIDGYGGAILGTLAFGEVKVYFAENFNLDELFQEKWDSREIFSYDKIFITDHCLSYSKCQEVDNDEVLREKIKILDHHKARTPQNDFDFIKVVEEENGRKVCGTSLFYNYLASCGLLEKTPALDKFVELTRSYDTWEWTKTNNQFANDLNTLALAIGRENYIMHMQKKLRTQRVFEFNQEEKKSIDDFKAWFKGELDKQVENVKVIKFDGYNAGYVKTIELFKNDIALAVKNSSRAKDEDIDFMLMPITDRGTVSLRNIKDNFDVNEIAKNHGGGGHPGAASFSMKNLHLDELEQ